MAKKQQVPAEEPQQQPAKVQRDTREPHEVNSSLSSPRMRALLEDHRRMGSRP